MSEYNIQMNKYNALNDEYDQLYPQPMKHANTHAKGGSDPITPANIGAVPTTRTVNGKALNANITLAASDVSAYSKSETDTLLQNKAPAGYGLGGEATEYVTGDFNNYIKDGWYGFGSTAGIANVPLEGIGYGVLKVSHGSQIIYQEVTAPQWGLDHIEWHTFIRVNTSKGNSDAWSPWECVNPPMVVGVEYRTTERFNRKPVYAKLVDFGSFPAATDKIISHNIENISQVVECRVYRLDNGADYTTYFGITNLAADKKVLAIKTELDLSAYSAYYLVKYTKTTD